MRDLKKGGGEGDEEGGGGPEKSSIGNNMSSVMADRKIGCKRVAKRLYNRPEKSERAQAGRVGVKGLSDLLVNSGKQ